MQFAKNDGSLLKFKTLIFYGKETNFKSRHETPQPIGKTFDSNLYARNEKRKNFPMFLLNGSARCCAATLSR